MNIPCVSIRNTTNIEYTVKYGTNTLVDVDRDKIYTTVMNIINTGPIKNKFNKRIQNLNDGNASERIAKVIEGKIKST